MTEQDPSLYRDDVPDYEELRYSSPEELRTWYRGIGSFRDVVPAEEYRLGENTIPNDVLFHAAGRMYMYATGMTGKEVTAENPQEAMRYVMRGQNLARSIEDSALALEAGVIFMEVGESVPEDKRHAFFEVCKTIFSTIANQEERSKGSGEIGALPKYDAVRFYHDIEVSQIRTRLREGETDTKTALEEYRQSNQNHAERFLKDIIGSTEFKNGDAYEHFVDIVARHTNWVGGSISDWSVRAAKTRQDKLEKSVSYDRAGKKLSFDTVIINEKNGEIKPIQTKAGNEEKRYDYSELIAVVDTLEGYDSEIKKRAYMENIVRMIKMDYDGKLSSGKEIEIATEFKRIKNQSRIDFI